MSEMMGVNSNDEEYARKWIEDNAETLPGYIEGFVDSVRASIGNLTKEQRERIELLAQNLSKTVENNKQSNKQPPDSNEPFVYLKELSEILQNEKLQMLINDPKLQELQKLKLIELAANILKNKISPENKDIELDAKKNATAFATNSLEINKPNYVSDCASLLGNDPTFYLEIENAPLNGIKITQSEDKNDQQSHDVGDNNSKDSEKSSVYDLKATFNAQSDKAQTVESLKNTASNQSASDSSPIDQTKKSIGPNR